MKPLERTPVLIVDCQTTGSSPERSRVLELGWGEYNPRKPLKYFREFGISRRLIELPAGTELPARISRLTGITSAELEERAIPPNRAWNEFGEVLDEVDHTLAHYARFEVRFLTALGERVGSKVDLEEKTLCTHEIARRLFGGLPRRGIRALAGYFGHSVPEEKRSHHHVYATAVIWRNLVEKLVEEEVHSPGDLSSWLKRTDPENSRDFEYLIDRERRLSLPDRPGIYRMLDRVDRIPYVGKATSLKSRVNSYFQSARGLSESKLELITQVKDVSVETTKTPLEAALLESDEIKEHRPRYNRKLRERDRSVHFCAPDWSSFSSRLSSEAWEGPFDRTVPVRNLRSVLEWIRCGDAPDPPVSSPLGGLYEEPAFREGLEVFVEEEFSGRERVEPDALLELGQRLWAEKADREEQQEGEASRQEEALTPPEVAERLREAVMWGTRQIRRGRWLRALSTSELIWKSGSKPNEPWRKLGIREGELTQRGNVKNGSHEFGPCSPGELPFSLTIGQFDRLRVLTTQLKRLLSENASIRVRTQRTNGSVLGEEKLHEILRWI